LWDLAKVACVLVEVSLEPLRGDGVVSTSEAALDPRASANEWASRSSFGHHQHVAGSARGEGLAEARPCPCRTGQPVVDVDAFGRDAYRLEGLALYRQVLGGRPAARISHRQASHGGKCTV